MGINLARVAIWLGLAFAGPASIFAQTVDNLSDRDSETTPPNTAAISAPATAPDLQIEQSSAYQPGEGITVSMLNGTSQLELFGSLSALTVLSTDRPYAPDSLCSCCLHPLSV